MTAPEINELERVLRVALRARATRLGLDPYSITCPNRGALIARGVDGSLVRLDYRSYQAAELTR